MRTGVAVKKISLTTIVTIAITSCTPAQRTGTLASASTTLLLADWMQTRVFVRECQELNPIIGQCGQHITPDVYFPISVVLNLAAGYALPSGWREAWFGAVAGAQASTVWANFYE